MMSQLFCQAKFGRYLNPESWYAAEKRHLLVDAKHTRQLLFQSVATVKVYGCKTWIEALQGKGPQLGKLGYLAAG